MEPIEGWASLQRGFAFKEIYPPGFGPLTGKPHIGLDVGSEENFGMPIRAHINGDLLQRLETAEGGRHVHFKGSDGKLVRWLHLSAFGALTGNVPRGTILGYMGNTGLVRPKPNPQNPKAGTHTHVDVSKNGKLELHNINNFEDPEQYFKQFTMDALQQIKDAQMAKFGRLIDPMVVIGYDPKNTANTTHYIVRVGSGKRYKLPNLSKQQPIEKAYLSVWMEHEGTRHSYDVTGQLPDGGDYPA